VEKKVGKRDGAKGRKGARHPGRGFREETKSWKCWRRGSWLRKAFVDSNREEKAEDLRSKERAILGEGLSRGLSESCILPIGHKEGDAPGEGE